MVPMQSWHKNRAVGSCNAHPTLLSILQLPREPVPNLHVLSRLWLWLVETRRASEKKCPSPGGSWSAAEGWRAEM